MAVALDLLVVEDNHSVAGLLDALLDGASESPSQSCERTSHDSYLTHLDGLRAVAVYVVVAFHAGLADFQAGISVLTSSLCCAAIW